MRRALLTVFLAVLLGAPACAASCRFTAASSLPFGDYDVFSPSDVDVMGLFALSCSSNSVPFLITLSRGSHAGGFSPRYLSNGVSTLAYNIYVDPGRTKIWGDGTMGSNVYIGVSASKDHASAFYDYAAIPAGQNVAVGSYSDSVTATLEF